jgi:uncharacterized protein (TIGR00255 family)
MSTLPKGALQGMTGFGRAEGARAPWRWVWEARSVNGRGLDLKVRIPPGHDALENAVREAAQARFKRGSLQVSLTLRKEAAVTSAARLDHAFLKAVIAAGEPYVLQGLVQQARWDGLLALRGAFLAEDEIVVEPAEEAALNAAIQASLIDALDGLQGARLREGAQIVALLAAHLAEIFGLTEAARGLAAAAPAALADKLKARIADLLGEAGVEPQRLAQEIALLAAKADVREELDRLDGHVREARTLLSAQHPIGRKLDFLTQEFNREANTLCSKSADPALTRVGLALKATIDQLREQAANVE